MSRRMSTWHFALLVLVGLIFATGYLIGNLPWEYLLK